MIVVRKSDRTFAATGVVLCKYLSTDELLPMAV